MDNILKIIKKGQVDNHTRHQNQADVTRSIKFTCKEEKEEKILFLDILTVSKDDGTLKLLAIQ